MNPFLCAGASASLPTFCDRRYCGQNGILGREGDHCFLFSAVETTTRLCLSISAPTLMLHSVGQAQVPPSPRIPSSRLQYSLWGRASPPAPFSKCKHPPQNSSGARSQQCPFLFGPHLPASLLSSKYLKVGDDSFHLFLNLGQGGLSEGLYQTYSALPRFYPSY